VKNCDLLPETGHLLALGQAAGDGHQSNFHFNPLLFAFGYAPQKMEQKKADPLVNDRIPRIYRPCRGDAPFSDPRVYILFILHIYYTYPMEHPRTSP